MVSQMEPINLNDSINHHANSPPIGGLLNFDQHSVHPVPGPSNNQMSLQRSQGKS